MTTRNLDDWKLLQQYARNRSERAFAELVRLHLDWVYSVALRHVSDPHLAEDVAQSVFVLLARKGRDLRPGTLLGGWLFRTTCHVAAHARRTEQRRKIRETTASTMSSDTHSSDATELLWQQLAPHLDQAVAALSTDDRAAILMRFYEKMPLRKVGERLGVSEDAAKKRVSRAVDRIREYLGRRGVTVGGVVLGAALAERTVQAASAALAGTVVKLSLAAASASTSAMLPQLARETLRAWRWARLKLAAGVAAGSLILAFVAVNAGGLFTYHSAPPAVIAKDLPDANVATIPQTQDVNTFPAPRANRRSSLPPKTGALTGLVVDELGQPVAGALVWGGFNSRPFAQDTTDSAGQFALDQLAAPNLVTVTADGFAADQQKFDPASPPAQMAFRLGSSRPLQLRVVDEAGRGIAGAGAFLSRWWGQPGTLGQHLALQTDADGRLQWLSAPKGGLEIDISKAGFRYSRTNKLEADGEEHAVVLHPIAKVTGNVTDVETGASITSFKFTQGHAQPWVPSNPEPIWDMQSRNGSNGFFNVVIDEEQAPYLRIEADAYETIETKIELTNGIEDVCNVQLTRKSAGNSIRGIVLLPDGSRAAGIEVALCTAQVGVMLKGTTFEPGAFGNVHPALRGDYRRKTDSQGQFSFDPKPGAHTIVAAGLAGLGQARCFDFSQPLEIRLQPWGRIEGNMRTRDGQWGGRKVKWNGTGILTSWMTLFYDSEGFTAVSDATGKFTLEHIPPGDGRVAVDQGPGTASILSTAVQVNAGETAQVQIGGGRPVTGKLVAPPGVEIRNWSNQVFIAQLHVEWDDYPLPKELTGSAVERWKLEFADTEAGRIWLRDQYSYDFKVAADGSFTIPEALPGKYQLFISVTQGYLGSGPDSTTPTPGPPVQIASGAMKIMVPDAPANDGSPLELGNINLSATH